MWWVERGDEERSALFVVETAAQQRNLELSGFTCFISVIKGCSGGCTLFLCQMCPSLFDLLPANSSAERMKVRCYYEESCRAHIMTKISDVS